MKKALFFFLALPLLAAAEENGAKAELEEILAEQITRPLRQVYYKQPYMSRPHAELPSLFTLPGIEEPLTKKYIEQFSSKSGRNWLNAVAKRSEPYLAFVRAEVERRGLPHELIYLPVIESAYSVSAVSRSGATGMWQFMRNSIGPYDMRVNEWMDERRDFWKSTIGALDKLEAEYRRVGSWELALAAYNAGLGTVLRAQKKHPGAGYWELCTLKAFKGETINYVPRLLAAAHVLSQPRRYGIEPVWPEDPQWVRIAVGRSVDLAIVAEYAGLPGAELKQANRELAYGITPPDPAYHIKVPASQAQAVAAVLENPELTLIRYYFHVIRSGDTLSGIARLYGITESQVRGHNPGLQDKYLKIGQRLIIPALKEVRAASAVSVTSAAPASVPSTASTSAAVPSTPVSGAASSAALPAVVPVSAGNTAALIPAGAGSGAEGGETSHGVHLVKRGETLWSIARAYKTKPGILAEFNGMKLDETLREGRSLKIPAGQ